MVRQVWEHSPVRGLDRLVLLGLADYANESQSGEAWPSAKTLADALDLPLRTVQRSLQRLRDNGDIIPVSGMKGGNSTTVRYRFLVRLIVNNSVASPATQAGLANSAPPNVGSAPPNVSLSPATLAEEPKEEPGIRTWHPKPKSDLEVFMASLADEPCPDGYPNRGECPMCRRDAKRTFYGQSA